MGDLAAVLLEDRADVIAHHMSTVHPPAPAWDLTAAGVVLFSDAATHDSVSIPVAIVGSVLAGFIARSWAGVPMALLLVPLAVLQPCDSARFECDVNLWAVALLVWAPVSAVLIGVGVAAGRIMLRRRAAS